MKTRKITSIIMVIAMLLSFATIAFAENAGTGSITITNPAQGETYSVYQLFDLSMVKTDNNESYAYTIDADDAWYKFFTGTDDTTDLDIGGQYVNINEKADNAVTWAVDDAAVAQLAADAIAYAKATGMAATATQAAVANPSAPADAVTPVEFTGLPLGYYLVDSSLGVLCALNTTQPNIDIMEKNSVPGVIKEVKEDSKAGTIDEYGSVNDAAVGETVEFKVTINLGKGAETLSMHDTMTKGLSFNEDVTVIKEDGTAFKDFTVSTINNIDGSTSFTVVFDSEAIQPLAEETLTVYYTAVVNADAIVRGTETDNNFNTVYITYGDENKTESTSSTTTTNVWDFNIFKHNKNDVALAGAQFMLYDAQGKEVVFVEVDNNGTYRYSKITDTDTDIILPITTGETGLVKLTGLDSGTYTLKEIVAPEGYNLLDETIEVTILEDGTVNGMTQDFIIKVLNKTGSLLPNTGGIGTVLFYVLGGGLVLSAVVMLITKKRKEQVQ